MPTTTGRIDRRTTFDRLRRPAGRASRGPIRVAWVPSVEPDLATFPQVGYAIGRHCGNAVTRNRLRRRLRAVVNELAPSLPVGAYLISGSAAACSLGHLDLTETVRRAMMAASSTSSPPQSPPPSTPASGTAGARTTTVGTST